MSIRTNRKQLVLRRDSATGITLVGWDDDLPVWRFEHLELICESASNTLPASDSEHYAAWQNALNQAQKANQPIIEKQCKQHLNSGWLQVPFELFTAQGDLQADQFGSYAAAAMKLQYHLTQNRKRVWVKSHEGSIVHVRARYPHKSLDELTYQVWYQKQLRELEEIPGTLLEGHLNICESGLWFETA